MSRKENIVVKTRVQVTIEVPVGGFGLAHTLDQVEKQATEEARNRVARIITESNHSAGCSIIGVPKMVATLVVAE